MLFRPIVDSGFVEAASKAACAPISQNAGMPHFDFPQNGLPQIEHDRFEHPNPLVRRRMKTLWLKAHGESHARIAELPGMSRATAQRLLDKYQEGGLAVVPAFHWKTPPSVLAEHRPQLQVEFARRPPHTTVEASERIEQLTGVRRGLTQVRKFLHDTLGLRWRKAAAGPVPPKQTLAEHAAHQAEFPKDGP
jgi:transposase